MRANNILATIGNTPHLRVNRLFDADVEVWVKLERANPGGSIKDRIALAMIEAAEVQGLLTKDSVIIEPTSGNTGIGLAIVAAVKGYRLILVMSDGMTIERRRLISAYGAEFVLTPREQGMKGVIKRAAELVEETENSWMPQQFENMTNVEAHRNFTAKEILADFPDGLDYLITGVGTGGHLTGVSKVLKKAFPALKTYAVEPALSPVLSGGEPGLHPIHGIGAGFVPAILDRNLIDGIIQISKDEAFEYTQRAAREEGLFVGVSSGAALAAVAKKLPEMPKGSRVITFCYDTGERYLSVEGLFG